MSLSKSTVAARLFLEAISEGENDSLYHWYGNEDTKVELTPEEYAQVDAAYETQNIAFELAQLRTKRNELLVATDWWVLPDRTATAEQLAYRQALRDITNTYSSLDDVVWPTKPE